MTSKPKPNLSRIRGGNVAVSTQTPERELFEMVYQWGRVGIVTDEHSPAYKSVVARLSAGIGNIRPIRAEREALKLTQADMAAIIGVSRLTYIGYEADVDSMSIRKYKIICRELDRLSGLRLPEALSNNNGSGVSEAPLPTDLGEGKEK